MGRLEERLLQDGAGQRGLGDVELLLDLALAGRLAAVPQRGFDAGEGLGAPALDGLLADAVPHRELIHPGFAGQQGQDGLKSVFDGAAASSSSNAVQLSALVVHVVLVVVPRGGDCPLGGCPGGRGGQGKRRHSPAPAPAWPTALVPV
jgi:hypothetical protein